MNVDVLIAGAGFSGLCMAIQLRRKLPKVTFLIVEKGHEIGGTRHENRYPGCACDVPSHFAHVGSFISTTSIRSVRRAFIDSRLVMMVGRPI